MISTYPKQAIKLSEEPVIVIPVTFGEYEKDVDLASLVLYVSTSDSKINQIIVFPFGTGSLDWNLEVNAKF